MIVSPTSRVAAHPFGCKQGNGRPGPAKNMPFWGFRAKNGNYGEIADKMALCCRNVFTVFVKHVVKNTENVKDLPFSGKFRKNFSLFTSYQPIF